MRGDSLRDLYAKSIALLGLGLLGGIGAAVDYWPTGVAVPKTAALNMRPSGARPMPIREWSDVNEADVTPIRATTRTTETPSAARIVQHAAFRKVSFVPRPAAHVEELQFTAPSTFTGFADTLDTSIALPALDPDPEVFSITAVADNELVASTQKGVLASVVSPLVDGGKKGGAAMANGIQAFGGAVSSAMKAGAAGVLGWFGRHDQKERQTRSILSDLPR